MDAAVRRPGDPKRLRAHAGDREQLIALTEPEGGAQAERPAADGAALAPSTGWDAQPLVRRSLNGEGEMGWQASRWLRGRSAS